MGSGLGSWGMLVTFLGCLHGGQARDGKERHGQPTSPGTLLCPCCLQRWVMSQCRPPWAPTCWGGRSCTCRASSPTVSARARAVAGQGLGRSGCQTLVPVLPASSACAWKWGRGSVCPLSSPSVLLLPQQDVGPSGPSCFCAPRLGPPGHASLVPGCHCCVPALLLGWLHGCSLVLAVGLSTGSGHCPFLARVLLAPDPVWMATM